MERLKTRQLNCPDQSVDCREQSPEERTEQINPAPAKGKKTKFNRIASAIMIAALLVSGSYYGVQSFKHFSTHEETDDAYVTGHLHQVSTRVNGTIEKVLVDDNEHVKAGQVLVLLDPRDYQVKVDQALANLEQAKRHAISAKSSIEFQDTSAKGQTDNAGGSIDNAVANISKSEAQVREASARISASRANLDAKEAELQRSLADYQRYENLEQEGAVSKSQRDAAKRDYLVALGNRDSAKNEITQSVEILAQAEQAVTSSKAALTKAQAELQLAKASSVQTRVVQQQYQTDLAAVANAKSALEEAQLNLSYTKIIAPSSGRIGKKTVEEGQRVEPGQPLLTIVADNPWVVANFKETQLKQMHAGQKVEIKIDSFPDHKFEGLVQSFSPASGASFAILPSDNATGNFTKIVQRLPVKILFTSDSIVGYESRLTPGLSVVTSVDLSSPQPAQAAQAKIAGL